EFMLQWSLTRRALRRPPWLREYAAWWGVSRSTAFRAQRRFRRCFPAERTPDRLLDVIDGAWDERDGLGGLSAVRVPLEGPLGARVRDGVEISRLGVPGPMSEVGRLG